MRIGFQRGLAAMLGSCLFAACGGGTTSEAISEAGPGTGGGAAAAVAAQHPLGFDVWNVDFPGAPEIPDLSPRQPGKWYDRTQRQALESLASKLQGNCSRDAWLMAKDFFGRIDPEDVDVLIESLDRAMQVAEDADLVENTVEAIGRAEAPAAAPALLRALEHPRQAVRNRAMMALVGSGTPEAVRVARTMFPAVDGRGIEGWIRAARVHLPSDEVVTSYRAILEDGRLEPVWKIVVENALMLPVPVALDVFAPMIGREPPALYATICGLRHAAGDPGGTALLNDLLKRPEPQVRMMAVQALRYGGIEELLDRVLRLTEDPDPTVRLAVVDVLSRVRTETVDLALESLTIDEAQDVRRAALGVLAARGRRQSLDELAEAVRNGTGSRFLLAIEDLIAVRDGGAVPAMVERMQSMVKSERRDMLRAIALTTASSAFAPLRDVFLADDAFALENRSYASYLMTNCRGAEQDMVELFRALPREDYRRRGFLMGTLSAVAVDREDPELKEQVYGMFREILADPTEIPQLRLSALGHLRRDLRIQDMSVIKRLATDEEPSMRKALMDFLFEFF